MLEILKMIISSSKSFTIYRKKVNPSKVYSNFYNWGILYENNTLETIKFKLKKQIIIAISKILWNEINSCQLLHTN